MSALPEFTGTSARCPKCNGDEITYDWQPSGTRLYISPQLGIRVLRDGGSPEWMRRGCTACGYVWSEATAQPDRATS